jgi:hypothetical protein
MTNDPDRLSELGSEAPAELRQLLQSARADLPSEQQLQQLAKRLAPVLGGLATAGSAGSAASSGAGAGASAAAGAAKTSGLIKLGTVIAGAAAVSAGLAWGVQHAGDSSDVPRLRVALPAASALFRPRGEPVAGQPGAPVEQQAPPVPLQSAPSGSSALSARDAAGKNAATQRPGVNEAQLLARAQAALASDPRRALTLTREHQTLFPRGALTQEREVIAIEALRRLGQSGAADQRAQSFRKQNPGSAHLPRIERAAPRK